MFPQSRFICPLSFQYVSCRTLLLGLGSNWNISRLKLVSIPYKCAYHVIYFFTGYAISHLQLSAADFNKAWNEKLGSSRQTEKKLATANSSKDESSENGSSDVASGSSDSAQASGSPDSAQASASSDVVQASPLGENIEETMEGIDDSDDE